VRVVGEEIGLAMEVAFFLTVRQAQDVDGGPVADGGWGLGIVENVFQGQEGGIGEVVEVVGDAVGAETAVGVEGTAEGGGRTEPEMDGGPENAGGARGGTDGEARNEAAQNFLLGMAQRVQDGGIG
jgi:hypothetical protein